MKSKKTRRPNKTRRSPNAAILDAFTERDLETWDTRSVDLQRYHDRVYYDLERHRAEHYDELCAALRAIPGTSVSLKGWARVTDWRWSLTPLSPVGSLRGIGGRFNIGSELDRARGQEFPCLYLAHDADTAFREYFGGPLSARSARLTLSEFALRRETSFTTFYLNGQLDHVFDLRESSNLTGFTKIIAKFNLSSDTEKFARKVKLPARQLIRTQTDLRKKLLALPSVWRGEPQMFGIPAPSQMFGRFVRDAGFEAVLYPSQRGGQECLAVFPQNFRTSDSCVEVVGALPSGASCHVLDKNHLCLDGLIVPAK